MKLLTCVFTTHSIPYQILTFQITRQRIYFLVEHKQGMDHGRRNTPTKRQTRALDLSKCLRFADTVLNDSLPFHELTLTDSVVNGSVSHNAHGRDGGVIDSLDIPDVNERLAYLKPSPQLLEFYRGKFAEQDVEHQSLLNKLEDYKKQISDQNIQEWGLRQREDEISELQKALSEIQISLFQEREQVLRLYAENDRYKIKDLSARRTIKKLIEYNEKGAADLINSPLITTRSKAIMANVKSHSYKLIVDKDEDNEENSKTKQSLILDIQRLQARLENQTRISKEKVQRLLDERQTSVNVYERSRMKDTDKVKTASQKLHKTQELLYMSTEDMLTVKQDGRLNERCWMIEKDKLLRELDTYKEKLDSEEPENSSRRVILNVTNNNKETVVRQRKELNKMRDDVMAAHSLMGTYQDQISQHEDELARLREQDDLKTTDFEGRTQKVAEKYKIMKKRFEELEKRRNLEVEGFKTDIKLLRRRLKEMETQLYRVTIGQTDSYLDESLPTDLDLAVLKRVHETATRSRKVKDGLQNMKLRIHNMESLVPRY